jgi:hypothetical protein
MALNQGNIIVFLVLDQGKYGLFLVLNQGCFVYKFSLNLFDLLLSWHSVTKCVKYGL